MGASHNVPGCCLEVAWMLPQELDLEVSIIRISFTCEIILTTVNVLPLVFNKQNVSITINSKIWQCVLQLIVT